MGCGAAASLLEWILEVVMFCPLFWFYFIVEVTVCSPWKQSANSYSVLITGCCWLGLHSPIVKEEMAVVWKTASVCVIGYTHSNPHSCINQYFLTQTYLKGKQWCLLLDNQSFWWDNVTNLCEVYLRKSWMAITP